MRLGVSGGLTLTRGPGGQVVLGGGGAAGRAATLEGRVRNDTGADQPVGAVLAYALQTKPSGSTVAEFVVSFNLAPLAYGTVPADRDDNFCVLLAPIPAGATGPAAFAGLVGGPDSASTPGGPVDPFGAAYGQYLQCVPGSTAGLRRAVRGKAKLSGGGILLDFVTGGAPVVVRLTAYRLFNNYDFVEVEPEGNVAGQQYAPVPNGITATYPTGYATNIAQFFGSEASGPFDMPVGSVVVAWRDQRALSGVTQRWLFGPYYRVVAQTGSPNLYRWCIGTPIDAVTFTTTSTTSTTSTSSTSTTSSTTAPTTTTSSTSTTSTTTVPTTTTSSTTTTSTTTAPTTTSSTTTTTTTTPAPTTTTSSTSSSSTTTTNSTTVA